MVCMMGPTTLLIIIQRGIMVMGLIILGPTQRDITTTGHITRDPGAADTATAGMVIATAGMVIATADMAHGGYGRGHGSYGRGGYGHSGHGGHR